MTKPYALYNPTTHVAVPRQPTQEMLDAPSSCISRDVSEMYTAMLAAAPPHHRMADQQRGIPVMHIPTIFTNALDRMLAKTASRRAPDIVIGGPDNPYLRRWYLIPRNRAFNIYLHHFMRSDDDRALHDHPWVNMSLLLSGEYTEVLPTRGGTTTSRVLRAGDMAFRGPRAAHRVLLHAGHCWTLFITGPRIREWGFWCPHGWRHWKEFTAGPRGEAVGKGCE